jgi:dTDP-4-dehydrorhamnose reductase
MTILVTGGNGQLGSALQLASVKSSHRYIYTDIDNLDITSAKAVEEIMAHEGVDMVVNCAAYTAVDLAEEQEKKADEINNKAVAILAQACKRHNAALIHISTDYIFAGDATAPIAESATPAPRNAYGRTKLAGEIEIAESGCKHIILRTSWLYSEYGKNFVKTMRHLTSTLSDIRVVADQIGTPTYAGDLAKAIVEIIESEQCNKFGTYNYSNLGKCSWFEFAVEIARQSGNNSCKINSCSTEEYPTKAERPRYSVLDKSKFINTFGIAIPEWRESLTKCIKHLNKQ